MVWFESAISHLGFTLSPEQLAKFDVYARRLLEENKRASLTSSNTDRDVLYRRHFAESLAIAASVDSEPPIIDIGSGGGFPGIPIAIARPDLAITLVEANGKKARFLESIAAELGLARIAVIQERAEDLGRDPVHRERYAIAIARAVAPLRVLAELALPLVAVGGRLAAPKGSGAFREIRDATNALAALGAMVEETPAIEVPGVTGPPQILVVIRKSAPTPGRFPRRPGIPAKRPL